MTQLLMLLGAVAGADEEQADEATTNPLAARNLARVQPSYQHIDAGRDSTSIFCGRPT